MRYMLLAYGNEKQLAAMATSERDRLEQARRFNVERLRESGHLLGAESLKESQTATTVRICNSEVFVVASPAIEADEQLLEIFSINARDLNEAIWVASQLPQARSGSVEVRPVLESTSPCSKCGQNATPSAP